MIQLNVPNTLTFLRILAIPVLVMGIMSQTRLGSWIAILTFITACLTDFLDGWLARRWNQMTKFGQFLDPVADKVLVATTLLLLAKFDYLTQIGLVAAVGILCREILVSGLREILAFQRIDIPPTRLAKLKTLVQMLAITLLLLDDGKKITFLEVNALANYLLFLAAVLTIWTGYQYLSVGLRRI